MTDTNDTGTMKPSNDAGPPHWTTDINTTEEMFETLIGLVTSCIIARGKGLWLFNCLGKENSVASIVAHAHIFLSQMRDNRGDGTVVRITRRCLDGILQIKKDTEGIIA